ncbi:Mpp10 protein [Spraguea lophii 42_110]|uniref:Mpp10 protein n=1 Tax=Spraguea lophii (strain 42_110) TaxID=1358809 RepID=S7W9L8_SPRLO|nr:Mpp10 protein [Spraguea lophii 42_110]
MSKNKINNDNECISDNDISDTERLYTKDREWMFKGEVKSSDRPKNSLLEMEELDHNPINTYNIYEDDEADIDTLVRDRLRSKIFDNIKSVTDITDNEEEFVVEEEELEDIEYLYNELDKELNKISNSIYGTYANMQPLKNNKYKNKKENRITKGKNIVRQLKKFKNVEIMK